MEKDHYTIRTKIWIETPEGETVFGSGQIRILEAIDREGSISAAARAMGMGYRAMWGKLKKLELRTGKTLLVRKIGGAAGGKSELTPEARAIIAKFNAVKNKVNTEAAEALEAFF